MPRERTPLQRRISDRLHQEFGRRVQKIRRDERDIRQEALADELGLSRATISKIEGGKQRVTLDQAYQIAYRLGVAVSDLLPDPEQVYEKMDAVRTAADDPLSPEAEEEATRLAEHYRKHGPESEE